METLSAYARQFLDQMERPDVDSIDGLSPAISIEQKTTSRSPRSTVGTITEIYDYLRLLYSSIGIPHCPNCGRAIRRQSVEQIVAGSRTEARRPRDAAWRPSFAAAKVNSRKSWKSLRSTASPAPASTASCVTLLDEEIKLDKRKNHTIEVVIDRLLVKPGIEKRLAASVDLAMKLASGLVQVAVVGGEEYMFSASLACPECGINVPQLEPRSFSFNSVYGACPECHGLGSKYDFDPAKVIVDWSKPLLDGGLGPGSASGALLRSLQVAASTHGFDLSVPFEQLPSKTQGLHPQWPDERR